MCSNKTVFINISISLKSARNYYEKIILEEELNMDDLFKLLKNKDIIAILDGDKDFGTYHDIKIAMPYLSGPDLCSISTNFGLQIEYGWNGNALSRWVYLDNLIDYCIENKKIQQLLSYLFSKNQFSDILKGLSPQEIDETHNVIINKIIEQINGLLYFGGHEFITINKQFIVKPTDGSIEVEAPTIKIIDSEYIKGLSDRALNDIEQSNYDSAITKCRTLIEEVFCYVIELKNETPSQSGKIEVLFNQVKSLYNMHQDREIDKRINMLLSGLEKIITSISLMRNKDSDSHGVGSKRINISEHHARLFLNASIMTCDFILAVGNKN